MISFENDYNNGAHPKVLQRLVETNSQRTLAYGDDEFCESAKQKIMAACEDNEANIFFLSGGTQTNATVIDSLLYQYEGHLRRLRPPTSSLSSSATRRQNGLAATFSLRAGARPTASTPSAASLRAGRLPTRTSNSYAESWKKWPMPHDRSHFCLSSVMADMQ